MFAENLERAALTNGLFRKVLFTSPSRKQQVVLMTLAPREEIGSEIHPESDQFFQVIEGKGELRMGDLSTGDLVTGGRDDLHVFSFERGAGFLVPANTRHNIVNRSSSRPLRLYTVYSPAVH
jgi:mannose-6-phosphate isomerase-like protein (cupin superfamily)